MCKQSKPECEVIPVKRFFTVFLPLMLVLALFFACSSEEATFQKTAVENVRIAISDVSASGATVTIWDTNETPYLYGSWYEIEKKDIIIFIK